MASGTADLDYTVLNPKDFPKRDYRRGYLINAEKKLQRKERSNPDEARFNVVFQKYSRSKRKRFKPYTNEVPNILNSPDLSALILVDI